VRLVFLGTPEFAVPSLRALHEAGHEIALVVSQPDRPRGRGQKLSPSALRRAAIQLGLANTTLERGQRDAVYQRILELQVDAAIVVAFGQLIRQPLLDGPRLGCLNVHASLLPRWRGAAPIQRAILAGDTQSGVCVMRLEAGLDTGPVYARESTPIAPDENAGALHDRLATMGAALLVRTLASIQHDALEAVPQSERGVTHAPMLEKCEGSADFRASAEQIARRVRAFVPWPGVTVLHGERRLKLLEVETLEGGGEAGRLRLDEQRIPIVSCGQGSLRLSRVQPEGKAAMDGAAYWRGAGSAFGDRLLPLPDFQPKEPA